MSRARAYTLAGCVAAVLGGYLLARALIAPGGQSTPGRGVGATTAAPATTAAGSASRSRSRPTAPRSATIDARFARSELGAAAAAGGYLTALAGTLSPHRSGSWVRAIRTLTVGGLTGRALDGVRAIRAIAGGLAQDGPVFVGAWLLGYRVISYSPARASVAVWNVGLVASPERVLAPYYSTATCTLVWVAGAWKVAAAQTRPGPTPPTAAGQPATGAFIQTAGRFVAYRDVP